MCQPKIYAQINISRLLGLTHTLRILGALLYQTRRVGVFSSLRDAFSERDAARWRKPLQELAVCLRHAKGER
ncbi:MAG: hypothetical protein V7K54_28760 [Nostoc sp.]